jgi:diadenosine tetraphosphate (Ap4A) HIT family hydrolase
MSNLVCPLCVNLSIDDNIIFANDIYRIVWGNEANYPCFIRVVWQQHVVEMTDLSLEQQHILLQAVLLVERILRNTLQPTPDKINLMSLGNQVPHLHWHIVPRYCLDAHWPNSPLGVVSRQTDAQLITQMYTQRNAVAHNILSVFTT